MTNTPTVNLKTICLFLFLGYAPFLVSAETTAKKSLQTLNCPIENLVINSSDDINFAIDTWLATSNQFLEVCSGFSVINNYNGCLLYTSPSPRDATLSRMPSSA